LPRNARNSFDVRAGTYHYPDPISPYPLRCYCVEIPDVEEYRAAFYDSIMQLTRWFSYMPDANMSAKQAADYMASVLLPQLVNDMPCCCDKQTLLIIQTNITLNTQIHQATIDRFDGSDFTTININAPTDNFDGDASADREAALCMALKNYFTQYLNDAINQAAVGGFITGALFATGLVLLLTGVGFIAGLLIISDFALLGAFVNTYDVAEMTDFVLEIACCATSALKGQAITRATWAGCLDGCAPGGGANDLVALLKSGLSTNFEAFINVLGQAYLAAQAGVEDCNCGPFDMQKTGGDGDLVNLGNGNWRVTLAGIPSGSVAYEFSRVGGGNWKVTAMTWTNSEFTIHSDTVQDCTENGTSLGTWDGLTMCKGWLYAQRTFNIDVFFTVEEP
jgi:hypothetical protein